MSKRQHFTNKVDGRLGVDGVHVFVRVANGTVENGAGEMHVSRVKLAV